MRARPALPCAAVLVAVLALLPGTPTPARAGDDEDIERSARRYYDQGLVAYKDGRYDEAIRDLRRAYMLRPAPRILLNLGHTYRARGDTAEALGQYRRFLKEAPPGDGQRHAAEEAIAALDGVASQRPQRPRRGKAPPPEETRPPPRQFAHEPVTALRPEPPLRIWAYLSAPPGTRARVLVRRPGRPSFEAVEMRPAGKDGGPEPFAQVAELPADLAREQTFQYYVEVRDGTGALLRSSGTGLSPHVVRLDPQARGSAAGGEKPASWSPEDLP